MALSARRSRIVFIVIGLTMVAVAVVVIWRVPRGKPDSLVSRLDTPEAVARLRLVVDSVDGARSTIKLRLGVGPAEKPLPPEGITVFTNVDNLSTVKLQPGSGNQEAVLEVPMERGEISAYPFDSYEATVRISAEYGSPAQPTNGPDTRDIPLDVEAFNSAVGFDVGIDPINETNNSALLTFNTSRTTPVVTWVSIMMTMYWLLSFAVISVTAVVVMGLREWESRHLAWLGAMIFAFASFRTTAPGAPPVGVYLDFAAFFWAEVIVAVCLMALVGFYLLGLRDPDHDERERKKKEAPPDEQPGVL